MKRPAHEEALDLVFPNNLCSSLKYHDCFYLDRTKSGPSNLNCRSTVCRWKPERQDNIKPGVMNRSEVSFGFGGVGLVGGMERNFWSEVLLSKLATKGQRFRIFSTYMNTVTFLSRVSGW